MKETCGHDQYGQSDMSGCVEGTYYVPCEEPNCSGICESIGSCQCTGCPSPWCCRLPETERSTELEK